MDSNKKSVDVGDIRVYISQVMKRAYSSACVSPDDARALTAIAMGLDRFLKETDKSDNRANALYTEMKLLTEESLYGGFGNAGINIPSKPRVSLNDTLCTESGKRIVLGNILGHGGEGTIYRVPSMPGKVAKIYRSEIDIQERERHLKAIIRNQVPSKIDDILIAAIPEEGIYTESGEFVGCVMPQVNHSFRLYDILRDTPERSKFFPELDYKGMIAIAINLAEIVDTLHRHNVLIGDFNFGNIAVNMDGTVCLVDADSFDVVDPVSKERFSGDVGVSDLLAPEIHLNGQVKNMYSKETDYFSLAVLIFRLLMENADPFGYVTENKKLSMDLPETNSAIINGECLYVKKISGKYKPDYGLDIAMFSNKIIELFTRAFLYDRTNYKQKIAERPSAAEWMEALYDFYQSPLVQCRKNSFHWYRKELPFCPFCNHPEWMFDIASGPNPVSIIGD